MCTMIRRIFGRTATRPTHYAAPTVIQNDEFAAHLNRSIGKLMSACKRADATTLPGSNAPWRTSTRPARSTAWATAPTLGPSWRAASWKCGSIRLPACRGWPSIT